MSAKFTKTGVGRDGKRGSSMKHFLCKLLPPRPSFSQDMTDGERKVMQKHAAYWADLAREGVVIVFGPVADPSGTWGVAIVEAESEEDVRAIGEADPATQSELGFSFEAYWMPVAVLRN